MTEQHPISPPEELVDKWSRKWFAAKVKHYRQEHFIAIEAARWGSDQELEACAKEVSYWSSRSLAERLRTARRPKPQSLKEQAFAALDDAIIRGDCITISDALPTIRRALEQLDD